MHKVVICCINIYFIQNTRNLLSGSRYNLYCDIFFLKGTKKKIRFLRKMTIICKANVSLLSNVVEFTIIQYIEWNSNTCLMEQMMDLIFDVHVVVLLWPRSQTFRWALTFSLFSVGHNSRQAMLSGQLVLPRTIWSSYSLVMLITEKFEVLSVTFRESIYHLMRHPAAHLQDNVDHKKVFRRFLIVLF